MNQEILHKYIAGEATQEEKEDVARWLDADKENMREFLAQRKLYDISIWQINDGHYDPLQSNSLK